jgi:hypothetical protein
LLFCGLVQPCNGRRHHVVQERELGLVLSPDRPDRSVSVLPPGGHKVPYSHSRSLQERRVSTSGQPAGVLVACAAPSIAADWAWFGSPVEPCVVAFVFASRRLLTEQPARYSVLHRFRSRRYRSRVAPMMAVTHAHLSAVHPHRRSDAYGDDRPGAPRPEHLPGMMVTVTSLAAAAGGDSQKLVPAGVRGLPRLLRPPR